MTYLRIGGPDSEWEQAELGEPGEFATPGDAGGFLDLLGAPHEPDEDGGLPRGAVRTIIDFDDHGAPALVQIPPTDS